MEQLTRKEREKQMREEEILQAAEGIFCEKGYDAASMEEIAAAAQFTRKTLYQYFTNKEDLYFAVALKGFKKLSVYISKASERETTGYKKVCQSSAGYYRFFKENPTMLKLMGYIGHVRKRAASNSDREKELIQYNQKLFESISTSLTEGIQDGSIDKNVNAAMASFGLIFMMTGFFNQLSVTGETYLQNFKLEEDAFVTYTMDLLFRSIKNDGK